MNGLPIGDLSKYYYDDLVIKRSNPLIWFDANQDNNPTAGQLLNLSKPTNHLTKFSVDASKISRLQRNWRDFTNTTGKSYATNNALTAWVTGGKYTLIGVALLDAAQTQQCWVWSSDTTALTTGTFGFRVGFLGGANNFAYADNYRVNVASYAVTGTRARNNSKPVYVMQEINSQQTSLYENGKLTGVGATGAATIFNSEKLILGGQRQAGSASLPFNGAIALALFYERILSQSERIAIDNYILRKYGILKGS